MKTLVAIPVYNEEQYVSSVLQEVAHYADNVLVIDDGSTDQTPTLLAKLPVDVIRHRHNMGYGRSIRDAFRWAQCYNYDWLITMDCDEQHEPASLPDFFSAIAQDDADILSGSRYLSVKKCGNPPPQDRREINRIITHELNEKLGFDLTDAFCGYKGYRVRALKNLSLDVDGYAMPIQLWVQAAAHGMRVAEIPIRLIYNDPNRSFGGPLDDPQIRLGHYRETLEEELRKHAKCFADRDQVGCSA